MSAPNAVEILAIIKLIQDLSPTAVALVRGLLDRLQGMTPEQVAQLAHTINTQAIEEIDAELAKLPPAPKSPS
jgi:hypothetical protein